MQGLLALSKAVDKLNTGIGWLMMWMIFASTVISCVNAIVRKAFDIGSNAFLEVQWYLFATSFLLAAGYTLLNNEHVRIDVVSGRFSKRGQIWIDIIGFVLFLLPVCFAVLWFSMPWFLQALRSGETSANAGGLILWPVYAMLPLGFSLLLLQAFSELIKRFAFLKGLIDDPTAKKGEKSAEEELAEEIRRLAEANAQGSKA
ncbi:MAG TPA: TRAP transporter small permease subunit [Casimicrobium huifangae]|jgi:TRAP-type mannitol/chloroaromatic compound transport system permease small subunit|uniref:TRAP transporter small permease subunit n=1 Tax=Casimicrobium huifangae TaxID=2591109 RepID=UPI0012EB45DD|nr:TRAP transporter small permease subunit [Casimicrobium huifangae]HQA33153.1 TRAP transporter small permease subunit [Casimicrobium huifangae]HQD66640.1 TRAP transporter small permease subunit [Casimicrobium huifangae]